MKSFFSPGKVILSGEHSVVYGEPALVSSIDLGIEVFVDHSYITGDGKKQKRSEYLQTIFEIFERHFEAPKLENLSISIKSNLPQKSGLGSSAAFAHAVFLALLGYFKIKLSKEEIFKLVLEAENSIHGISSGVDPSAVVFGGLQVFQKESQTKFERKRLKSKIKLNFTLINSGESLESTGEMVSLVKEKVESDDEEVREDYKRTIKNIGKVTSKIIRGIENNNIDYSLISENQRLLEDLGVVGEKAKRLVKEIEEIRGFAKITGAGGVKKGSGWLLVYHPNKPTLDKFISKKRLETHKI